MSDLKHTVTKSLIWNAIDKIGFQAIALAIGIVTARILSPDDFGYIAALALFTTLSNLLVESGFTSALVRRYNNTNRDYSGAFYFNLGLSIALYLILYVSAPFIASYFKMPVLESLARVLFSAIIINAFGIIPNIILTRNFQFKYLSISNLLAVTLSGVITIYMALNGYAYWAIAAQQLTQVGFRVLFTWIFSRWIPSFQPNFRIVKELLSFSSALILSNIITSCVRYIYNLIIGPNYPTAQLGAYGQAYKFQNIATSVISTTLTGVSYPIVSKLNEEKQRQTLYIRKLMRICAFLTFPALLGLYAVAPSFISVILTDKWIPMLPYFRILLLSGAILPVMNLIQNTIIALGYPKADLLVNILRNISIIGLVLIMNSTIEVMLWGYFIANCFGYLLAIMMLSRHMEYTFIQHIKDVVPYAAIATTMVIIIQLFTNYSPFNIYITFLLQIVIGGIYYLGVSMLLGSQIIKEIRQIIFKQ